MSGLGRPPGSGGIGLGCSPPSRLAAPLDFFSEPLPDGLELEFDFAESFFASLQCELLDRRNWPTRAELARAMFEWIEAFHNPTRRHSTLDYLSPIDYEAAHAA